MFAKIYMCGLVLIISLLLFCASWNEANADQKAFIVVFDQSISEIQKEAVINQFGGIIAKDLKIINGKAIILDEAKAFDFSKSPGVMRLTIDGFIQLDSPIKPKTVTQLTQVVPWGVQATGSESLGKIVTTKVDVAIMDTGIDLEHPDLKDNIVGGINIVDPSVPPMDIDGHGTQVAGIVAGVNNKTGVLGVAPKASLHPVCVFRKSGNSAPIAFYSDIIAGLEWCAANRMKVVNISFGSYVDDPNIREAVAKAISAGVVIVASAGNNGSSNPFFPASYPDVIAVSAVDNKGNVADWSNFGPDIDLTAPGVDILTTSPQGKYIELSGTDFSAPHVTGAMALALAVNIKPQKAIEILFDKTLDAGNSGKDDYYGYGTVDAKRTAYSAWWQIPLTVNAKAFPVVGSLPLAVSFSGEVLSGPPTKPVFYKWDFDSNKINDFTNVISAETAYIYTRPGVYIATLQVTDFLGKTATDFVVIAVKLPFSVDLIADPPKGYTPLSVNFQANLTGNAIVKSYDWDFDGDGTYEYSSGTTPTATYVYETEGLYLPMVKLTDVFGNFVTDYTEIDVKPPLNISATADPNRGEAPLNVNLSATITGGSGNITSIEWDFESDGTVDYTGGVDMWHTYPVEGIYSATITVTDDWGGTASYSVDVTVINPFKVLLSADHKLLHTSENTTFTAVPNNGTPPISYEWDFNGDGVFDLSSGSIYVTPYAYSVSGIYNATVKATDTKGRTATDSVSVEVMHPVTVRLSADSIRVHTNENISFTAETNGGFSPITYEWDFNGDGIFEFTSENNVMDHSYSVANVYTVTVKAVDNIGGPLGSATASIQVDVKLPVTVTLHTDDNTTFTANASGGFTPITYEWDFNDDEIFEQSSGIINVVNHQFNTTGKHNVRVKATDDTQGNAIALLQVEFELPLVVLSVNKPIVHVYDIITFTATTNGGFTSINYSWDFNNDGVFEQSSGTKPTIIYAYYGAGIYTVKVKAIDDIGTERTATAKVEVKPPLVVDLVANPSSGRIPLNTKLTASVQNGISPVTYTWDLDGDMIFELDGGPTLNNTFNAGTYKVTVKAADDSGSLRGVAVKAILVTAYTGDYVLHTKWGNCNEFSGLGRIAIDDAGYIYAADGYSIKKFGPQGTLITQWGTQGTGPGQFGQTGMVAVDKLGRIFVFDGRFQIFDSIGKYIGPWFPGAVNPTPVYAGIAFDSLNNVYLSDGGHNRVFKFNAYGNLLKQFVGSFETPQEIAIDNEDNVYVLDVNNDRIQKFDSDGKFLALIGDRGWGAGKFQVPTGLAVDGAGNIFATDYIFNSVQKFDTNGNFVSNWGGAGSNDEQFNGPAGIVVDKMGYVYVSDSVNCRIQKFRKGPIVVPPLEVTAKADPNSGNSPLLINLSADFVGAPISYEWDFTSDGTYDSFSKLTPNIEHTYPTSGNYTAKIKVTDDYGTVAIGSVDISVTGQGECNYTFYKKWGTQGNGNGQLNEPFDVTVDSAGYVYVVDMANDRIVKFGANGTYLLQWGSNGIENGKFDSPRSIAVVGTSDVFVVDSLNNRIQVFDTSGGFKRAWGIKGTDNGQFTLPNSIAVDSKGNLYVTDYFNNRVQKFDFSGTYLLQWGSIGNGDKQFSNPAGIAIDPFDNVYVVDVYNKRIQKFDSNGNYLLQWGTGGTGIGQFQYPTGIAVDKLGDVYVTDYISSRVQKFSPNGIFIAQWGTFGALDGQFDGPQGICVDGLGYVYVVDMLNCRIQKFVCGEAKTPPLEVTAKPDKTSIDVDGEVNFNADFVGTPVKFEWFFNNTGTTPDYSSKISPQTKYKHKSSCSYTAKIVVTDDYGTTASSTVSIKVNSKYAFVKKWGSEGTDGGKFANGGMWTAIDYNKNYIYVTDFNNNRWQRFDLNGNLNALGGGMLKGPAGIVIDNSSNVYIADSQNHRIMKFDSNLQPSKTIGSEGTGDGQFKFPQGVAVDKDGNIYVCDTGNNRIQKFGSDGNFLWKVGVLGSSNLQFQSPKDIAVDSQNNVYVVDGNNHRIQMLDQNGGFLRTWGSLGDGNGQFQLPHGVCVDKDGYVYVADFGVYRVQKFDSVGNYITQWGCRGIGDGLFQAVADVAVDSLGFVYVTDTGYSNVDNDLSIQKFVPVDVTAPPFIAFDKRAERPIIPEKTTLLQNYPNPFNPETWIPYQLKEDSEVNITIYNSAGQLIRRLELGYKTAGIYATQARAEYWDGTNEFGERVSSGVYFYNIQAGKYVATKKMIILQ